MKALRILLVLGLIFSLVGFVFAQEDEIRSEDQEQTAVAESEVSEQPSSEEAAAQVASSQEAPTPPEELAPVEQELPQEEEPELPAILEINRLGSDSSLYSMELRNVELADFFRVAAHDYGLNFLVDRRVKGMVTASLTSISLDEALSRIAKMHNLTLQEEGNVIMVKPNLIPTVFNLKHVEAATLLAQDAATSAGAANIYNLLSEQGKALLGKFPNSIMVIDYPENLNDVRAYINMVDRRMSMKVFKLKYINAKDIAGKKGEAPSQ